MSSKRPTSSLASIKTVLRDNPLLALLAKGGSISILIKVSAGVLAFLMFAALARSMETAEYSKYVTAFSAAMLFGQLATFGQSRLVLRYLGQYGKNSEKPLALGVLNYAKRNVIGLSMIMAAIFFCGIVIYSQINPVIKTGHFFVAVLFVFAIAAAEYFAHAMRGFGYLIWAMSPRNVIWRLSILAFLGISAWTDHMFNATEMLIISFGLLVLCITPQFLKLNQLATKLGENNPEDSRAEEWKKTSQGFWLLGVFTSSFRHLVVIYLGFALTYVQAGAYFSALRVCLLLPMPLIAVNMFTAPMIARSFHSGKFDRVQRLCRGTVALLLPFVVISSGLLLVFREEVLLLFDEKFLTAAPVIVILTIGFSIGTMMGPSGNLMQMSGHERTLLKFYMMATFAALFVMVVTVPMYGVVGAAYAMVVFNIGWKFPAWYWCRKNLRIDPSFLIFILGKPKQLKSKAQPISAE